MPITEITPLPTPPSRQDPVNFSNRADTFLGALPTFATEVNTVAESLGLFIANGNYTVPVAYAAGVVLNSAAETVEYSGNVYALKFGELPYTLTGNWVTDSIKLRLIQGVAATDLAASDGAAMVGYMPAGTGAVPTDLQNHSRKIVYPENYGADPTGNASSSAAFAKALEVSKVIHGTPGAVYLIDSIVDVGSGYTLIGNGATIKGSLGAVSFRFKSGCDNNKIQGWNVDANDGLYTFINYGQRNSFMFNTFSGNVGHYIFNAGAFYTKVALNSFECESAAGEVTTCVVFENSQHFSVLGNSFNGVPVGWGVQVRVSSQSGTIIGNTFRQFLWNDEITATAGQTVFNFTLGSVVSRKGLHVDGKPLTQGYTITGSGPSYTVTFASGRAAGEVIKLLGYRGAENIQLNTSSFDLTVSNNVINGTGDSGIVCLADRVSITNNIIKNAGYCGIALYGGQNNITVTGNVVSDCSLFDDGLASPENPLVASTFNGGIMASGSQLTVTGNVIVNDSGTMAYGIRVNTVDNIEDGSSDKAIKIGNNVFRGEFSSGKVWMPQDTSGKRIQSVTISDGLITQYPGKIAMDAAWTNAPTDTDYWISSGFGGTISVRDTTTKLGGVASLRTVAGEYVDFTPTASGMFKNCIIKINFWAKNNGGSSYCSVFSTLSGLNAATTVNITDTNWREYTLMVPLTDNLSAMGPIRFGATLGNANIQHIDVSMIRI